MTTNDIQVNQTYECGHAHAGETATVQQSDG
jgi:hypothetical protein